MNRSTVYYSILSLLVFVVDRITKYMVIDNCDSWSPSQSLISITLTYNRGVSWSFFDSERADVFAVVTLAVSMITIGLVYYTYQRYSQGYTIFGNCLVLPGAISNLVDRIVYGGVIDFVCLSYRDYQWPIFNIADVAIVVGVMIMLFYSEKRD